MSANLGTRLVRYEAGEVTDDEFVGLFADLVANGMAWTMQGHYGRQARALIDAGWISEDGVVLHRPSDNDY